MLAAMKCGLDWSGLGIGLRYPLLNWSTGDDVKAPFGRVVSGERGGGWRGEEDVGVGVEAVVLAAVVVAEVVEVLLLSSEYDGRSW